MKITCPSFIFFIFNAVRALCWKFYLCILFNFIIMSRCFEILSKILLCLRFVVATNSTKNIFQLVSRFELFLSFIFCCCTFYTGTESCKNLNEIHTITFILDVHFLFFLFPTNARWHRWILKFWT